MTKNTMIFIFLNMIYLLIWHATNKIRSTKAGKELDNGFEFYNSLNTSDKENYWKEDTKILNLFFVLFIISMDISVILLFNENILRRTTNKWINYSLTKKFHSNKSHDNLVKNKLPISEKWIENE